MPPKRGRAQQLSNSNDSNAGVSTDMNRPSTPKSPSSPSSRRSTMSSPLKEKYDDVAESVRRSWLPSSLGFVAIVILNFGLSLGLLSLVAEITAGDLAAISKHTESWWEIAGLLEWKAIQLAVGWFGGFHVSDIMALTLLIHTPKSVLLSLFYSIRPTTILLTVSATILSIAAPFMLMYQVAPRHAPHSASKARLRNRPILTDTWTTISTSLLATTIFAVLLELSFATFLPVHLITHFTGVRDLSVTHLGAAGLPSLLATLVPAGYAAREFLFVSSTGALSSTTAYHFDPVTAGLGEHLYHNAWGCYSSRQKELIRRTALLMVMLTTETVIQIWGTIKGVEFWGAACYAALWAAGVAVVGAGFEWVGGPSS